MQPKAVPIRGDVILLQAFLKVVDAISTGGEVKWYLAENPVRVNGEEEARRGRQLRDGDVVELVDGRTFRVQAS